MKKTVLFHSNSSKSLTGFGKNAKNILSHLYLSGKYNIVELANGIQANDPSLKLRPWKCVGGIPSDTATIQKIKKDSSFRSQSLYGGLMIEKIIEEVKPDIYIGAEDIWAFSNWWEKRWWKKINTILWTTIDSIPILKSAQDGYKNSDAFFCWSKFASKEMQKIGCKNVDYLHGPVDSKNFYRMSNLEKNKLRESKNIDKDLFITGFVFRNQIRKSVSNLLDGFKDFHSKNKNARLLLHTNWQEGWDIPKLLKEKNIDNNLILTTYVCNKCQSYEIKPFAALDKSKGEKQDCKNCGAKGSQNTINVSQGVSEDQLNEIYNIMDVYCHPFTSGGQEIPIQEAKLCGLITLVTNYSCGEDCAGKDSGGFPLDWNEYRETGTQFIKASTCPQSISKNLQMVKNLKPKAKEELSNRAIDFVLKNYSIESTINKLMATIDSMPKVNWDYKIDKLIPNIQHKPLKNCSDEEYIIDLYENMLNMNISPKTDIFKFLKSKLKEGVERDKIYNTLKANAEKELEALSKKAKPIEEYLSEDDIGRRLAIILPQSIGDVFMSTALLPEIRANYPDYNIYYITKPQYFEILEGNEYIHKVIPYTPECADALHLEGYSNRTDRADHNGYFDIAMLLNVQTQRITNYTRNGIDKLGIELCTL